MKWRTSNSFRKVGNRFIFVLYEDLSDGRAKDGLGGMENRGRKNNEMISVYIRKSEVMRP